MWIITILLAAFSFAAQSDPTAPEKENKASIQGIVTQLGTGEPIPRALVQLTRGSRRPIGSSFITTPAAAIATTDENGRFVVADLEPGQYRLQVFRNGFVQSEYGEPRPGRPGTAFDLGPAQEMDVRFAMLPAARITGRVYNERGELMPGVSVKAFRSSYGTDGRPTLDSVASALTNDLGEYRLYWLAPGEYFVAAGSDNSFLARQVRNMASNLGYVSMFYPGVMDYTRTAPLVVSAGDLLSGIDLRLVRVPTVHIRGEIVSAITGVSIGASRTSATFEPAGPNLAGWHAISRRDAEGGIEIRNVTPGSYNLRVTTPLGSSSISTVLPVEVRDQDIENLRVVVGPVFRINSRIYLEESPANVESPGVDWNRVRVSLVAGDGTAVASNAPAVDGGTFAIDNVVAGRYEVRLTGDGAAGYYLKRVRFNGSDVAAATIDVTGSTGELLDVLLSPNGGRIDGVVAKPDGAAVPAGTQVVLIPDEPGYPQARLYQRIAVDKEGRFSLRGIAPGAYRLFAWEYLESSEYYNAAFVARFKDWGQPVRIGAGDRLNVSLRIIPDRGIQ